MKMSGTSFLTHFKIGAPKRKENTHELGLSAPVKCSRPPGRACGWKGRTHSDVGDEMTLRVRRERDVREKALLVSHTSIFAQGIPLVESVPIHNIYTARACNGTKPLVGTRSRPTRRSSSLTHMQPISSILDHPLAFRTQLTEIRREHGRRDDRSGFR